MFLIGIVALVIIVDQITKAYVVAHLDLHASWMPLDFVRPFFRFTHIRNTGAAFGIFEGGGTVFTVIALVVSVVVIYYYRQISGGMWLIRLALGLQLGGALGNNVIDRPRLGYVVDFLHIKMWPVFNVADISIVSGVVLLMFVVLRDEWRTARQTKAVTRSTDDEQPCDSPEEPALYQ
ncbi:MAG: signal peptidase II [Chloroflexi bacterium]|nr:signal peptidase II [Chloroflexota bacterium]